MFSKSLGGEEAAIHPPILEEKKVLTGEGDLVMVRWAVILNRVVRTGPMRGHLRKDLKEVGEGAMWGDLGEAFLAAGADSAKTLRQKCLQLQGQPGGQQGWSGMRVHVRFRHTKCR